ncbi:hypothetical protein GCM10007916_36020 [Psychromonas marina]|uniref:Nitrogen fixation protein NifQ n=1 Tax=Psychromonas marina TaxID=88364 RepID=A0ABQ6E5D4_9GAMM|nr:nitrogen fixation protein NifQ [Psychromonas marina]GLS92530.1 hypothetical protein GCM10007916_36020 [Psychromonas marina]
MNNICEQQPVSAFINYFPKKLKRKHQYTSLNLAYCKQIIRAQLSGNIVLPHGLGLSQAHYQALRKAINDADLMHKEIEWYNEDWAFIRERAEFCTELFSFKEQERNELILLLSEYGNKNDPSSALMAIIVATACLTQFHLWESLGLSDRAQLGKLIQYNFPELYALNSNNMRWKRFFYKQLCEQGGDYLCKAPSCTECRSYAQCFA